MGEKKSKWQDHLKAGEASGLKLSAYAARHQSDVRRLYEARRLRARQGRAAWAVVRVKPEPAVQVAPNGQQGSSPTAVAMQARLGNGVILSWTQDQRNADAPASVLRTLATLPCFV